MAEQASNAQRVALVTGASSGIGSATAARLAADGFVVHAVARRAERLERLSAATGAVSHVLDVTDLAALASLVESVGPLDVLVNNAGLGKMDTTLADTSIEDIVNGVDTNIAAVMVATKAALPAMVGRRSGHIVNIGSMAGLYPLGAATYGASKGAVHRLSTNLRLELRGSGVRVTEICPGRVTTEFYDVAIADAGQRTTVQNSGIDEVTPDDVADAIAYAVGLPRHVNINRIELQPTEQTYGGSQFDPIKGQE